MKQKSKPVKEKKIKTIKAWAVIGSCGHIIWSITKSNNELWAKAIFDTKKDAKKWADEPGLKVVPITITLNPSERR